MQFVFDLDGTICFKGKPISERLLCALEGLIEAGHEIVFASARPIRDMLPVVDQRFHHLLFIGGNGSLISQAGKRLPGEAFTTDQISKILELIIKYQCTYLIDSEWDYAYTGACDHPILNNVDPLKLAKKVPVESLNTIVKILILSSVNMERLLAELAALELVVHQHSRENVLDLSPQNIHKWSALQKAGLQAKQFIAFGNDANDISMFQAALYSVRIGDHAELGQYAMASIAVEGDYEGAIIEKIEQLSKAYAV